MTTLHRKLIRDLRANAATVACAVMIMAIGVGALIGMGSAQRNLELSQAAYYRAQRFADFWIDVKKAPLSTIERLATQPGVAELAGRVVFDVLVDLPSDPRPLTGRLISTPRNAGGGLNAICLVRGSGFSSDTRPETIVNAKFAEAHGLEIGDRIGVILNRRHEWLTIVGTAISPEYVYMVRGQGDLVPDPTRFGILYVPAPYARATLDFQDACNQVSGRWTADLAEPRAALDGLVRRLDPFGVIEVTPRDRQASHRFLSDEIAGLAVASKIMPVIFLGVAGLVLDILILRLTRRQRTLIGTLKALGYGNRQIRSHYLTFGGLIGLAGGVAGLVLGAAMMLAMMTVYREFFQFPTFVQRLAGPQVAVGFGVSLLCALAGTLRGVRSALRLRPADAMRPPPPERGRATGLERWPRLWHALGFRTQMALRSIWRHPGRTLTAIVAMTLSTALVFMALAMYDSFIYLVDHQFHQVLRSDADLGLRTESGMAAWTESRRLPGVDRAEPLLGVRGDLCHGRQRRRVAITGLSADHRLTIPRDSAGRPIAVPPDGVVLARKLAELLDVGAGGHLTFVPVLGRHRPRRVRVAAIVDTFLGLDCYADLRYLSEIQGEALALNGIQLQVDPTATRALFAAVKALPEAAGLSVRQATIDNIESTLIDTSVFSIGLLVCFAGAIAFGSAVNGAFVEIDDRVRELSTLRVLGYHPAQVSGILLRQNATTALLGAALALPLGHWLVGVVVGAYDSELYRLPVVVRESVLWSTLAVALLFQVAAQVLVHRRILRLDWLAGVQVKE